MLNLKRNTISVVVCGMLFASCTTKLDTTDQLNSSDSGSNESSEMNQSSKEENSSKESSSDSSSETKADPKNAGLDGESSSDGTVDGPSSIESSADTQSSTELSSSDILESSESILRSSSSITEVSSSSIPESSSSHEWDLPGWNLIWQDEFNGEGKVDSTKWGYQVYGPDPDDAEEVGGKQNYTDRLENVIVKDGHLTISALKEVDGDFDYTSGRIMSYWKASFSEGKLVARAKLAGGRGSWSAIWMVGNKVFDDAVGWPACGEIDVLEYVGHKPNVVQASAHSENYNFKIDTQQAGYKEVENAETEYHTYSIEWFEDSIDFFVDGEKYLTAVPQGDEKEWPFNERHFIIMNLAVGGWGAEQGIDSDAFPMSMEVDYVRVYKTTESNFSGDITGI